MAGKEVLSVLNQNMTMSQFGETNSLSYDSLMPFDDEQLFSENAFFTNGNSDNSVVESSQNYPNLAVCLPKWKVVFPWLQWDENSSTLHCRLCLAIAKRHHPGRTKLAEVSKITCPGDVFNVAGALRNHGESLMHCVSWCLVIPNALHSLVSVTGNLFLECKSVSDALDIMKVIFCDKQFKFENFVNAIKSIANCIEQNIIDMVKTCTYFSVVSDQCRGLIILRIVEHRVRIEEHVLWSYVTVYNKTPMEYLSLFGLDFSKLIIYVANTPCQQCPRCAQAITSRAKLPPRSPSIRYFSCLLWQEEAFRPLFIIINQIIKLWKLFPFLFVKWLPQFNFPYLLTFYINPTAVLPVLEHFETFRLIFLEIYEKHHLLECLGLYQTRLINEEPQRKFLTILQEILDILSKTGKLRSISSEQIICLSQALVSLRNNAKGLNFIRKDDNAAPSAATARQLADSVFDLVEKFIDENKKVVYYCGKDALPDYFDLYNTKALTNSSGSLNVKKLSKAVSTVISGFGSLFDEQESNLHDSVVEFYQHIIRCNIHVETCTDMVNLFWKCPSYEKKYQAAYKLSLLGSTLPFQPCRLRKQMFTSFVVEQKYEHSFWNKFNSDMKPWLLYIHDELPFTDALNLSCWWKKIASTTNL